MALTAYAILALGTFVCLLAAIAGWYIFRSLEFVLIPALTYYYTLFGAWKLLSLKLSGGHSDALDHLEASLVWVNVDADYVTSLAIYVIFLFIFLFGLIAGSCRMNQRLPAFVGVFSVKKLVLFGALSLFASAWVIRAELIAAIEQGVSIYLLTRGQPVSGFTLHQLLNRAGLVTVTCAWVGLLIGPGPNSYRVLVIATLGIITAVWGGYLGILGNRNEMVLAAIGGLYLYALLGGRIRWPILAFIGFLAFATLRSIETLRAEPPEAMGQALLLALITPEFWNPASVATGSESLAAHISLYGLIHTSTPLTYGSSLIYFFQSLVPFVSRDARIPDSYQLYAQAVGAPDSQGFNIHFAAGAWLNGGLFAVVVSAFALALVFCGLRLLARRSAAYQEWASPALVGYAFLCAMIPVAMRSGPEGMKALLFEGFVMPFLVAWFGVVKSSHAAIGHS